MNNIEVVHKPVDHLRNQIEVVLCMNDVAIEILSY